MSPCQQAEQTTPTAHRLLHKYFQTTWASTCVRWCTQEKARPLIPSFCYSLAPVYFSLQHTHTHIYRYIFLAIPLSMWDFIYSFIWLHWVSITALRILVPWSVNPCPLHQKYRVLTMDSQGSPQIIFFLFLTGRIFGEVNLFLCKETEKLNDPPTHPQPRSRVEQPCQKSLRPLPPHLRFRKQMRQPQWLSVRYWQNTQSTNTL